jgi:putative zinc finger/helix-turn-helix YgiT family protein
MTSYVCEGCSGNGRSERRGDTVETRIELRDTTLPVRGESVTLTVPTRICAACGEPVYDRALDNATLERAYAIYRSRHDLVSADEVRALREKYAVSQRNLALLLGWSEATINRYEKGAAADRAHSVVLRLLRDAGAMRDLVEREGHVLPASVRDSLWRRIVRLIEEDTVERWMGALIEGAHTGPDLLTGYRPFSPDKLSEMVLFFAQEDSYETKLHKELWYADFAHFRRATLSISGESYVRSPFGPTMREYPILDVLRERGDLEREETFDERDGSPRGRRYRALRSYDRSAFASSELEVMGAVRERFSAVSCEEISRVSHLERAWGETEHGQLIPYDLAAELKAM